LDAEGKGELSLEDLKNVAKQTRFNLSDEELQQVIERVGGSGANTIPAEQFEYYLARRCDNKDKK
jgi:Ca2+-binding EF-hand superfamily protein